MTRDLRRAHRLTWLVIPIGLAVLLFAADAARRRTALALTQVPEAKERSR
jgi:hypothetical protein